MKQRLITIALLGLIAPLAFTNAYADNLIQVFNQALESDPTYQATKAQRLSEHQNIPITRSLLLPQVSADALVAHNHQNNNSTPPTGIPTTTAGSFDFESQNYTLNATQVLFNYESWLLFQQAKTTTKIADAQLAAQLQVLMSKTSQAYFNVLNAEDDLRYIQSEKRAVYRQLDQVKQQYKVGLVSITGVYQAQAQYDLILSEEIAAKNTIVNRKEDLRVLTGIYYKNLAGLKSQVPLVKPKPTNVEKWVDRGDKQNWTLQAAKYSAEALEEEIGIQRSGHYPVLNAVAQYDHAKTGTTPSGKVDTKSHLVGVQLDLPIFEGFRVVSQTKQAEYNYQAALDNTEQTRRDVTSNVRQNYNNVIAGISKIQADRQAIISNESSLRSTMEAYKVGTQTMLDVLEAQQDLFNAQRTYAGDQYGYINATIALKEAAGTLNINDLGKINAWLTESKKAYHTQKASELEKRLEKDTAPLPALPNGVSP